MPQKKLFRSHRVEKSKRENEISPQTRKIEIEKSLRKLIFPRMKTSGKIKFEKFPSHSFLLQNYSFLSPARLPQECCGNIFTRDIKVARIPGGNFNASLKQASYSRANSIQFFFVVHEIKFGGCRESPELPRALNELLLTARKPLIGSNDILADEINWREEMQKLQVIIFVIKHFHTISTVVKEKLPQTCN